jgi:hypothetical protein
VSYSHCCDSGSILPWFIYGVTCDKHSLSPGFFLVIGMIHFYSQSELKGNCEAAGVPIV